MKIAAFVLSLMLPALCLSAETVQKGETPFKITDLFEYRQPVKKGDDEKKVGINASVGYTEKSGNTDSTALIYSAQLKYDDHITEFKIYGFGSYGELKGKVNDNKGSAIVNFDYFLFWRIEFFSYTMSDYNRITKLTHRNGSGAGLKMFIIRNSYLLIDISGTPIFQYEKYEENDATEKWRWSLRGRFEIFPFSDDFSIKYVAFYIPEMGHSSSYRTTQELTISKKLSGILGLKAGYRREYNTYDKNAFIENPALKKTDSMTYIQASLTY